MPYLISQLNEWFRRNSDILKWDRQHAGMHVYVCIGFVSLRTSMGVYAKSQESLMLVSVRRVHVALPTAGFKGGGEPSVETRETD